MPSEVRSDVTGLTLSVASIGLLAAASLWIFRPFLGATIWAAMVVVSTWPVLLKLQRLFRGHRAPAVLVLCLGTLLLLAVPLTFAVSTVIDNAPRVSASLSDIAAHGLPEAPAWFGNVPLVGARLTEGWTDLAASGAAGLLPKLEPYAEDAFHWALGALGSVGGVVVQFLLMVVIAAVMYSTGESAVAGLNAFGTRLAGTRGPMIVDLAGKSIRGIALGVVVTALLQAAFGGLGLLITGVPYSAVFVLLMFLCCVVQIGPVPILAASTIWLYAKGDTTMAIVLLVFTIIDGTVDNIIRPWLIKKGGADLSILLIVTGVVGGLIAFGLLGIFIGPLVLAVTFTLVQAWVRGDARPAGPTP